MTDHDQNLLCTGCLRPVEGNLHFCNECGAPVGPVAVLDPIYAIQSQGNMFRQGARRPTALIVFGMWLIFLPSLIAAFATIFYWTSTYNAVLSIVVSIILPAAILYRVTRNYWHRRNRSEKILDF